MRVLKFIIKSGSDIYQLHESEYAYQINSTTKGKNILYVKSDAHSDFEHQAEEQIIEAFNTVNITLFRINQKFVLTGEYHNNPLSTIFPFHSTNTISMKTAETLLERTKILITENQELKDNVKLIMKEIELINIKFGAALNEELTAKEVHILTGRSVGRIHQLSAEELPYTKFGRDNRYKREDVLKWKQSVTTLPNKANQKKAA